MQTGETEFNERWAEIIGFSLDELSPVSIETWFAVVADEIRKLAEQSTNSTKMIDGIVKELQNNSSHSVKVMSRVAEILEKQMVRVTESKDKYLIIDEAMKENEKELNLLNISGEEMKK